jgi:hypothetical protein
MPCYHPITGYRARSGRSPVTGLWPIVFSISSGYKDLPVVVPCGQCIGCRLERSRVWAVRCVHESSLYLKNCFVTLTYANAGSTLVKRDFVLFIKRLRKKFGIGIRYFHCGEYGEKFLRPHHHACIFNFDFPDKKLWSVKHGNRLYTSENLDELWGYGYCIIGDVTFDSAAYVARYILKKVTGNMAESHYDGRVPEYTSMSRRPGIASSWFNKYKNDVLSIDGVIVDGNKCKPPRYYDKLYDIDNKLAMQMIKARRRSQINLVNNTYERLRVREICTVAKLNQLNRSIEGR